MPIKESDNKNVTTNANSSTNDIESITVNSISSTSSGAINDNNSAPLEEYDLSEPMVKEGILDRNSLDFSRIGSTAGNVKEGNFTNVRNPEYWGDNAPLSYKIRDDGTVAISEGGVILGFTDLQGIRIKEADSSKEEQIITEETSNVTNESQMEEVVDTIQNLEETEDIKTQTVEIEEEEQEEIVKEIKEESKDVSVETLEETPKEEVAEVQEEIAEVQEEVQQPVEQEVTVVENPQPTNEKAGNVVSIPGNVRQTGIIKNYTNYSYFYGKWNKGSGQERVAEMWAQAGKQQNNGIATLNGRYLVAVSPIFGTNGDIIDVVLEDGTTIPCIIGDAKGADATSQYGHMFGKSVDVIEWESFGSKEDIIIDEWADKNVVQIINKGSIFPN